VQGDPNQGNPVQGDPNQSNPVQGDPRQGNPVQGGNPCGCGGYPAYPGDTSANQGDDGYPSDVPNPWG
jgi:hypothetical protein